LAGIVTVVATAVALGLSSASAGSPGGIPSTTPPDASGHSVGAQNVGAMSLAPAKSETLFYALKPCRIVDTRAGGGILHNTVARNFYVSGTFGFAPQGGHSGGCGVPLGATGVTANVTVANTTGSGYLTGYPAGTTEPTTNFITYQHGVNITANPTFAISTSTPSLTIKANGGDTHVIIDVTGYYVPQIEGMVSPGAAIYSGSSRLVSAVRNGVGNFTVTVDSDVTYCTPTVTAYSGYVYASAYDFNNNKVQVFLWYLSAGTQTAYDGYFYLKVDC